MTAAMMCRSSLMSVCMLPLIRLPIDQACVDAANSQPVIPGSAAAQAEEEHEHHDVFRMVHPDTDWEAGLIHAEKLGIGTRAI